MLPIYLRHYQHLCVARSRQHRQLSGGNYGVRRFKGQARPARWPGRENLAAQAGN